MHGDRRPFGQCFSAAQLDIWRDFYCFFAYHAERLGVWKAKRKRGGAEEVAAAAGGRRADRQNQAVRALPHAN